MTGLRPQCILEIESRHTVPLKLHSFSIANKLFDKIFNHPILFHSLDPVVYYLDLLSHTCSSELICSVCSHLSKLKQTYKSYWKKYELDDKVESVLLEKSRLYVRPVQIYRELTE